MNHPVQAGFSALMLCGLTTLFALPCIPALAGQPRAAPLFPSAATVLLVSGLPGDAQLENLYGRQLQSWAELALKSGIKKLLVLCDNPDSFKLPPDASGRVLNATRTNFLALAQELHDTTNGLVVIAWGHGGRQGDTPVLHVRGPRITVEDFISLASEVSTAPSKWLLFFSGSGAFAGGLRGPGREVISSDSSAGSSSDPVSMGELLKAARAHPQWGFEQLAQECGKATVTWYSERGLARTEQPTLWLANGQSRSLAEPSPLPGLAENVVASTKQQREPDELASEERKPALLEPPPLPPAWRGVTRVQAQGYSNVDAVVLHQNLTCVVAAQPAVASEQEQFIQVLTPEGKHFGDFDVSYSPPEQEIEFLDCEVLRPDGELLTLDPEGMAEVREESDGDYQPVRRKRFSLPGVMPGAILHVRYRTQWERFPAPSVSMNLPLAEALPVLSSSLRLSVPNDSAFHFAFKNVKAPPPVVNKGNYNTTYSWNLPFTPANSREALSPPASPAGLLFSTCSNWSAFGAWFERISRLADEVTPEIAATAIRLTQHSTNDLEKVSALYAYVTQLRYVAVPLGVNSFRPHAAIHVLEHQFGDCKDKANLLNALLHSLKLDACLVLVPRFGQAHEEVPGFSFNHAISRVRLGARTVWLDTTDDICRFGLLPPGDPGRMVLVVDGQSQSLTQLPTPEPKDNRLEIGGRLDCSRTSQTIPATLHAAAYGYPDYELRAIAREARRHAGSAPLLDVRFRPAAGWFALANQESTAVPDLAQNFRWSAQGSVVGLFATAGGTCILQSPFWVPREWDQALHKRASPLYLQQGFPLKLEEEFEITLPGATRSVALPGPCASDSGPLEWRIKWDQLAQHKLTAHLSVVLTRGDLSLEDTPRFQQQLQRLLTALNAGVTLSLAP